jgi:hypothetical protein
MAVVWSILAAGTPVAIGFAIGRWRAVIVTDTIVAGIFIATAIADQNPSGDFYSAGIVISLLAATALTGAGVALRSALGHRGRRAS